MKNARLFCVVVLIAALFGGLAGIGGAHWYTNYGPGVDALALSRVTQLKIDSNRDQVALEVEAHSPQALNVVEVQKSDDTKILAVDNNGNVNASGYVSATGVITATSGFYVGTVQWNSGDNIDGTKVDDADLGDVGVSSGVWAVEDDSHAHTTSTVSGLDISADTNLAVSAPIVLTDDTLSHSTANGYVHTPADGLTAQFLQYASAGTSKWITMTGDATIADGGAIAVADDSHAHTTSSISGLDISTDTNLTAGDHLTLTDDDLNVDDDFLLNTGDICAGNLGVMGTITATSNITSASKIYGLLGMDAGDANITNVGDIALDTLSSDMGTTISVSLGTDPGDDFIVSGNKLVVEGDTGNVGIGTTGPGAKLHVVSNLASGSTDIKFVKEGDWLINASDVYSSVDPDHSAGMVLRRARGTGASPTTVANGDYLGYFSFRAYDGNSWRQGALVAGIVNGTVSDDNVPTDLIFRTGSTTLTERVRITSTGNVGIGTTGPTTKTTISGTLSIGMNPAAPSVGNYLAVFGNATTTPTLGTNTAGIFAADVSGTTELWTIDEAGNLTQQTPHPTDFLAQLDPNEPYPMGYCSYNYYLGKKICLDIVGSMRWAEQQSGEQFVYYTDLPEDQILSWDEYQQAEAKREDARRLAEAAAILTPTLQVNAVESYPETITRPVSPTQYITSTVITYELDPTTGRVREIETVTQTEVTETIETGSILWRLKSGCQLSEVGIFMCPVGEVHAVYEPYEKQPMPKWMQDRIVTVFLAPKDISGIEKPEGEYKRLLDVGSYSIWVARAEAETLKGLHQTLWGTSPVKTLGCLAAMQTYGESFWDYRVQRATGMTGQEFLARRDRIASYLASLGKDVTLLRQATNENEQIEGIVVALGRTMQDLWDAMR